MKEPLIPEEILAFFVLSNLNKDYSIKQFLMDREKVRSKFRRDPINAPKTEPHQGITEGAIHEREI